LAAESWTELRYQVPRSKATVPFVLLISMLACSCGSSPQATQSPGSDPAISAAEKSFVTAIHSGDAAALGNLLDANFEWIAVNGKVFHRADTLKSPPKPALADEGGADMTRQTYSDAVSTVTVNGGKIQELRVWVKRPEGWRALIFQEVGLRDASLPPVRAAATCDNPCKDFPFTPQDDTQRAVANAFKTLESAVASGNAGVWRDAVGYEFLAAGSNMSEPLTKTAVGGDGIGFRAQELNQTNQAALAPVPVVNVTMQEFPGVVVIRSRDQPTQGNPLEATRVWLLRNSIWIETVSFATEVRSN
jgi:hypothetical protein